MEKKMIQNEINENIIPWYKFSVLVSLNKDIRVIFDVLNKYDWAVI